MSIGQNVANRVIEDKVKIDDVQNSSGRLLKYEDKDDDLNAKQEDGHQVTHTLFIGCSRAMNNNYIECIFKCPTLEPKKSNDMKIGNSQNKVKKTHVM